MGCPHLAYVGICHRSIITGMNTQIPWAPVIGVLLVVAGIAGWIFGFIPSTEGMTIITIGLGVLGIHSSNTQLAGKVNSGRF